jgi:hypothetical protein
MTGTPRDQCLRSCLAARWIAARVYQLGNLGADWPSQGPRDRGMLMLYRQYPTKAPALSHIETAREGNPLRMLLNLDHG